MASSKICNDCASNLISFHDERQECASRLRLIADLLVAIGDGDCLTQDSLIAIGFEVTNFFDRDSVLSHYFLGTSLPEGFDEALVKSELLILKHRVGSGRSSKNGERDK